MLIIMICNICGQEMITHKFEELDVCDECQVLIDKELAKPVVKQS
jgi:GTP:adenosylcobinamide-phosphate guanylyltransferase